MAGVRDTLSLRAYGASHGSHSHAHYQVLVGLAGILELEVAGRGRRIGAGDAVLVDAGDRHDFESIHGSRCLVLDSVDPLWAQCGPLPHRPQQVAALANYLSLATLQPLAVAQAPALLLDAPGVRRPVRRGRDAGSTGRRWLAGCRRGSSGT